MPKAHSPQAPKTQAYRNEAETHKKALLAELKTCSITKNLQRGKQIHAEAVNCGSDSCVYVATALVNMYAKCRRMAQARQVFDNLEKPDVVCWNALIMGYAKNGEGGVALDLFSRMKSQGCSPDRFTFVAAINACTSALDKNQCLEMGKRIHSDVGTHLDIYLQSSLINMYSKCGSMAEARQVFEDISVPNKVSWNALILGYAENGEAATALDLFAKMRNQKCSPDSVTFLAALKACASLAAGKDGKGREKCLELGKKIHSEITCCCSEIDVQNALIDMYVKCGSMRDASRVFNGMKRRDRVSWNALILGYADNEEGFMSLNLLARMQSQGLAPDSFTFVAVLKACSSIAMEEDGTRKGECLEWGRQIHMELGTRLNAYLQSSLIEMYSTCGSMVEARNVFDGMEQPNQVSWNALILGYAHNGQGVTALDLFARMKFRGCVPSSVTFLAAIKSCASLAREEDARGRHRWLEAGRQIHSDIVCCSDIFVQNALIDMYASCGSMADARQVFDAIQNPDVVSWTALISGYTEKGESATALDLFARMRNRGLAPDSITLAAALKACAVLGALESGSKIHAEMDPRIHCNVKLVNCLVDFYSKCGSMVEAQKVFDSHPSIRNLGTWTALLAGYSRLGDNRAVFALFKGMQDAGFSPDGVTFLCILTCCSHAGLVQKAQEFFSAMSTRYGVAPAGEHYNCMVDILGRSKKLDDAVELLRSMPCRPDAVTWMTLLSSCRKWTNLWIGRLAFESLDDANDAAAYVLMADLYGSRGMRNDRKKNVCS